MLVPGEFVHDFAMSSVQVTHTLCVHFTHGSIEVPFVVAAPLPAAQAAVDQLIGQEPPPVPQYVRPKWQRDDEAPTCTLCDAQFWLFRRRSHWYFLSFNQNIFVSHIFFTAERVVVSSVHNV